MCAALLLSSISAFGWGPKGHDVVAAIAEQHLTKKAKKAIDKILDGKSIVYYSSWMDNIQNSPYWEYGYNKTKTWHYANVDEGLTYQTMTKNPDGDVVNGLSVHTFGKPRIGLEQNGNGSAFEQFFGHLAQFLRSKRTVGTDGIRPPLTEELISGGQHETVCGAPW